MCSKKSCGQSESTGLPEFAGVETFSSTYFQSDWDLKVQVIRDISVLKPVVNPVGLGSRLVGKWAMLNDSKVFKSQIL